MLELREIRDSLVASTTIHKIHLAGSQRFGPE